MSDGGSDADRRRWTHKRAQFDHAIHSARLLGFIQKLTTGEASARDIVATLLEVNGSKDQSLYVAETLAMKKEVRGIARQDFHPEVALFFAQASRLIPQLSDGLASQIMMLLGHAAQNDAYLDTVSNAVSELLADLDHPLSREARNYLRLLWDQIEATRRLKQTEALFPGSSMPPPSGHALRDSGKMPRASARQESSPAASPVAPVAEPDAGITYDEALRRTARMEAATVPNPSEAASSIESVSAEQTPPAARHAASVPSANRTIIGGMAAPSHLERGRGVSGHATAEPDRQTTLIGPSHEQGSSAQVTEQAAGSPPSVGRAHAHDTAWDEQTNEFFSRSEAPQPESVPPEAKRDSVHDSLRDSGRVVRLATQQHDPDVKLPTNSVPRWAVITAAIAVGAIVAAVVYVTRETEPESPEARPSASAGASAPSATGSARAVGSQSPPAQSHLGSPPPPPPPPESTKAEPPKAAEPKHAWPTNDRAAPVVKPAPARVAVDSPSVHTPAATKPSPAAIASSAPAHATSTESQPRHTAAVVTPPEVAKNMSPLDRIIAELRLISPDPVGIEDKARELSRIIATSKRKDAFYIIDHLGPSVALDALGRDPVLEESLRAFAISTLGRVALDDDDSRAVSAIFMLGEWAKSGGKGRQKAISALESISKERIIKASAPRTKALHAAQAELN